MHAALDVDVVAFPMLSPVIKGRACSSIIDRKSGIQPYLKEEKEKTGGRSD